MGQLPKNYIMDNIVVHTLPIGEGVIGFTYKSIRGIFHIFISDSLSLMRASEVLFHELHHIRKDLPFKPYIIGMDMQHCEFEIKASRFGKRVAARMRKEGNI